MSDVNDELDGSPILEEVLGDALGKLKVFHVKLSAEGEPRGLIVPRDVSWRPPACRTTSSLWWNRWNAVSNGFMSALTKWDWTMSR